MNCLENTTALMTDYDDPGCFKAEYDRLKIRRERLSELIAKAEAGALEAEPACSVSLLAEQCAVMGRYLHILETRAGIEGIEL